jgi:hypothetical protein
MASPHLLLEQIGSKKVMPKPEHISDLERRQKAIKEEITNALLCCSTGDRMIADLRRNMLHLRVEPERSVM